MTVRRSSLTDETRDLEGVAPEVVTALESAGRALVGSSSHRPSPELTAFTEGRPAGIGRKAAVITAAFGAKTVVGVTAAAAAVGVGVGVEVTDVAEVPVVHQIVEAIGVEREVPPLDEDPAGVTVTVPARPSGDAPMPLGPVEDPNDETTSTTSVLPTPSSPSPSSSTSTTSTPVVDAPAQPTTSGGPPASIPPTSTASPGAAPSPEPGAPAAPELPPQAADTAVPGPPESPGHSSDANGSNGNGNGNGNGPPESAGNPSGANGSNGNGPPESPGRP